MIGKDKQDVSGGDLCGEDAPLPRASRFTGRAGTQVRASSKRAHVRVVDNSLGIQADPE